MHIGILQAYFSRKHVGGGEIHTQQLADALMQRGHDVTIFTDESRTSRRGIEDLTVREYPTPVKINPVNELTLAHRAFNDMQECDVVVLTDESAWRGVDLPIPRVMVFHFVWHGWIARNRPLRNVLLSKPQSVLYQQMEHKIVRKANAIVSISPNMYEDIRRVDKVSEKVYRIPNGVDVDRFQPTTEGYDGFTVHFQGRLVAMKNPQIVLEAVRYADEDWRLTIGGDGPLRDDLVARAEQLGIQDRVEFLGYVPECDLPERYAKSDVYVLPSSYEGMPLTVLEAAASGTAVVASPRAATDFVTEEIGRVVEPSPERIAAVLDELAIAPSLTERLGENARTRANQYAWSRIAEQYEALFDGLVE